MKCMVLVKVEPLRANQLSVKWNELRTFWIGNILNSTDSVKEGTLYFTFPSSCHLSLSLMNSTPPLYILTYLKKSGQDLDFPMLYFLFHLYPLTSQPSPQFIFNSILPTLLSCFLIPPPQICLILTFFKISCKYYAKHTIWISKWFNTKFEAKFNLYNVILKGSWF